ncbi:acyltransferase [Chitinophagaceae bacterium LWZ2-11]
MLYKLLYVARLKCQNLLRWFRFICYSVKGAKINASTSFKRIYFTWPHKVEIGNKCTLEHDIYFKYDGVYSEGIAIKIGNNNFIGTGTEFNIKYGIEINDNCLIASGCRFIDHDHGISLDNIMRVQSCPGEKIVIKDDVWIGVNVVILKGVTINKGAIVAAGAVVTKSIPAFEIWGGVPAKKISERK